MGGSFRRNKPTFSQRYKYTPIRELLQEKFLDAETRIAL
jgi:hypothetical protein